MIYQMAVSINDFAFYQITLALVVYVRSLVGSGCCAIYSFDCAATKFSSSSVKVRSHCAR